jgi:hypothetical protein
MKWMCVVTLGCMICAGFASAGLITSAPAGGVTTTFQSTGACYGSANSFVVEGFLVSANGAACYDYGDFFGLGSNGTWHQGLIGDDSLSGTTVITVDLGGPYASVGGFMNYEPGPGTPPFIAALAADGATVLATYVLSTDAPISTGAGSLNAGAFRGISLPTSEIRYFEFGGSESVMHDITLSTTSVPEPSTPLLAGCALAALGRLRRVRS